MTRRQWTAYANDVHISPVDKRMCKCGKPVGEHDLGEDWILRADGCEGFEEEPAHKKMREITEDQIQIMDISPMPWIGRKP